MANVAVLNMAGKEVGKIELNDAVFGVATTRAILLRPVIVPFGMYATWAFPMKGIT